MDIEGFEYLENHGDAKRFRHISTGTEVVLSGLAGMVLRKDQVENELLHQVARNMRREGRLPN